MEQKTQAQTAMPSGPNSAPPSNPTETSNPSNHPNTNQPAKAFDIQEAY
jgi:hypothetical protein